MKRPRKKRVFFVHVPRAGGSSVTSAMRYFYLSSYFYLNAVTSDKGCKLLKKYQSTQLRLTGLAYPYRQHLGVYAMGRGTRFISGHIPFHQAIWEKFHSQYYYVTLLRHPVDRFISNYFFDRYAKDNFFKVDMDLSSFLSTQRAINWGKAYIDYFSGKNFNEAGNEAEQIEAAKENLRKFDVVGLLEEKEKFHNALSQLLGIKMLKLALRFKHVNKNPAPSQDVSSDQRKIIEKICEPDIEIYEFARKLA